MFRTNFISVSRPRNERHAITIDTFDKQPFNLNDNGFIRNDISQLARAQSKSQYEAYMDRLVQLKQEGNIKEGTTVDEAIAMVKPRYAQSYNEIADFIEYTNGNVMAKLDEAYKKALHSDDNKSKVAPQAEPAAAPQVSE